MADGQEHNHKQTIAVLPKNHIHTYSTYIFLLIIWHNHCFAQMRLLMELFIMWTTWPMGLLFMLRYKNTCACLVFVNFLFIVCQPKWNIHVLFFKKFSQVVDYTLIRACIELVNDYLVLKVGSNTTCLILNNFSTQPNQHQLYLNI